MISVEVKDGLNWVPILRQFEACLCSNIQYHETLLLVNTPFYDKLEKSLDEYSGELRYEPGAAGWEAPAIPFALLSFQIKFFCRINEV